jgi:hypothetical protein
MERKYNSINNPHTYPKISFAVNRIPENENRAWFETVIRIQRKSDHKWFLIEYRSVLHFKKDDSIELAQWLMKCHTEVYNNMVMHIVPEDSEINEQFYRMYATDLFQGSEYDRLSEILLSNKIN